MAKRQGCYLILGTMMEFDRSTKKTYCTTVVVGPTGLVEFAIDEHCRFDGTPCLSLLKHLLKSQGGAIK